MRFQDNHIGVGFIPICQEAGAVTISDARLVSANELIFQRNVVIKRYDYIVLLDPARESFIQRCCGALLANVLEIVSETTANLAR